MQEADLGSWIREERERHAWRQAELARRLGVRQQTVSRWERAQSTPGSEHQAAMHELFGTAAPAGPAIAGGHRPGRRPQLPPLDTALPVDDLSPAVFENFVADLADGLWPGATAHRYGSSGHEQGGADVLVVDVEGRLVAAIQCKRVQKFGPADVRRAVERMTLEADEYVLVLSRAVASPGARDALSEHARWRLWDGEDLARLLRDRLPQERQVRLVDRYFPGMRERLLGVAEPSPWERAEEFFRPAGGGGVFRHDWRLVGRDEVVAEITQRALRPGTVSLVTGRAGLGKSRLLAAVADQCPGPVLVRALDPQAVPTARDIELLPGEGACVLLLDDAHDRSDLSLLTRRLMQHNPATSFVAASRPYARDGLQTEFERLGSEVEIWMLDDLPVAAAADLAGQALGDRAETSLVNRLAHATRDLPLITVIAGVLISRGDLDPACLDHEQSVQRRIMEAFRDVLLKPANDDARGVLEAVAALQPVRLDDGAFLGALTGITGLPRHKIQRQLRSLRSAGILLQRGHSCRIVPDLLGDVVLADASVDVDSGAPTGFIDHVLAHATETAAANVLVNASRVEWQICHHVGEGWNISSIAWERYRAALERGGIPTRLALLAVLERVSFFQPERVLETVRWVVQNPTENLEDWESFTDWFDTTYQKVIDRAVATLPAVGYHYTSLGEAADFLWDLALKDLREAHRHDGHPLRVLVDWAGFSIGKPIGYTELMVDRAADWLCHGLVTASRSPFDVMDEALALDGITVHWEDRSIVQQRFHLPVDAVRSLRDRIVELALEELKHEFPARALRAVKTLGEALRPPIGDDAASRREALAPWHVDLIARFAERLGEPTVDPVVRAAGRDLLVERGTYSTTSVRAAALEALARLPMNLHEELAGYLAGGRRMWRAREDEDPLAARARHEVEQREFVTRLTSLHSPEDLAELIERQLEQFRAGGQGHAPGPLVEEIVRASVPTGTEILRRVVVNPDTSLVEVAAAALSVLATAEPRRAKDALDALLATGKLQLRRAVADVLGRWGVPDELLNNERDLLSEMATDDDAGVRAAVVWAAQRLLGEPQHRGLAYDLLTRTRFEDSYAVTEHLFLLLTAKDQIQDALPPALAESIYGQLVMCPTIDHYGVERFLADESERDPERVLGLLKERVNHWEQADQGYRPLPFSWSADLRFHQRPEYRSILGSVLDWMADGPQSWHRATGGAELFWAVAEGLDDAVRDVLVSPRPERLAEDVACRAAVVREAPTTLALGHPEVVERLLELAAEVSQEHVRDMSRSLHSSAASGLRSGVPGQPYPQDVRLRDEATRLAQHYVSGTPIHSFYVDLAEGARRAIEESVRRDAMDDGRDW